MTRFLFLLAGLWPVLMACSPAFNWREVRPESTGLTLLLPCKPDKAERSVPLGGRPTELAMLGCDAGGATFAVSVAKPGPEADPAVLLAGWQAATLAHIKAAGGAQPIAWKVPGAALQPPAVLVRATGQRADGSAVQSQAVYFAHDRQLFQAVMYADKLSPEAADTFFSSLKFESGGARP